MGSDNLFHRRKAKQAKELARKKAKRESYAKVLIVCEGEKTEPNYFNELKDHFALNSANVIITGDCGSDPMSVVNHALQQYRLARDAGDPFDKVFCVIDKDAHPNYPQAIQKLETTKPRNTFDPITSVPCFEYWLLLHFIYTTKPFQQSGNKSCCETLIDELRRYLPKYQKGDKSVFDTILGQLPQAKSHAINALKESKNNNNENPSTRVHELIQYLENIKK